MKTLSKQEKVSLIIGSHFRRRVVVQEQVLIFDVKALCRFWISVRFGRVGTELPTSGANRELSFMRINEHLGAHIRNLRKIRRL